MPHCLGQASRPLLEEAQFIQHIHVVVPLGKELVQPAAPIVVPAVADVKPDQVERRGPKGRILGQHRRIRAARARLVASGAVDSAEKIERSEVRRFALDHGLSGLQRFFLQSAAHVQHRQRRACALVGRICGKCLFQAGLAKVDLSQSELAEREGSVHLRRTGTCHGFLEQFRGLDISAPRHVDRAEQKLHLGIVGNDLLY